MLAIYKNFRKVAKFQEKLGPNPLMNLQMNSRYIVFIVFCVCGLLEKAVCVNESITVSNIANFLFVKHLSIKISINLLKNERENTRKDHN